MPTPRATWRKRMKPDAQRTIETLADGNPGAAEALSAVYRELGEGQFSTLVFGLRRLDFSGPQIYVCWSDFANKDLYKFFEGVRTKDPEMVSIGTANRRRS